MDDAAFAASAPRRRGRVDVLSVRGSGDLLLSLVDHAEVRPLLGELGLTHAHVAEALRTTWNAAEREPADWFHRLSQRGLEQERPLETLLALSRSQECDAYRAMSALGLTPNRLRHALTGRVGAASPDAPASARPPVPEPGARRMNRGSPAASTSGAVAQPHPVRGVGGETPRLPPAAAAPSERGRLLGGPSPRRTVERLDEDYGQRAPREHADAAQAGPRPALTPVTETLASRAAAGVAALLERTRVDPREVAPLFGRTRELRLLADAVFRLQPRPPLLVAESGVGRSALARALATATDLPVHHLRAPDLDEPESLRDVVAAIVDADGIAILDDLDRLCAEPTPELLAALGWVWSHGGARVVGVVSPEGRARLQAWMPGIHDMLDPILVPPLALADTLDVVADVAPEILAQHGLTLAPGSTLVDLARIAERVMTSPALPGRALALLDLSCARARREGARELTPRHWVEVASERTGLSTARIEGRDGGEALDLERELARRVVGHTHVLDTLARAVRRNRAGFAGQRPILVALLLGPSGVGKTEIAKAVADLVFDHDEALLRLDMSEYAEGHAVARIVGAPPGYVGHEAGGVLSEAMTRRPHRVLLLDEIEKAHRDVHQLLLQVFDDGRLTDGRGRTLEFRHTAVIMTSNLGAELVERDPDADDEAVLARARAAFPVELWNRIESPLVLRPLTTEQLHDVCKRLAAASSQRLFKERGIRWTLGPSAEAWLVERARRDPALGARPLRHLLGREVESLVAELVLRGQVRAGGIVRVDADAGALAASVERQG